MAQIKNSKFESFDDHFKVPKSYPSLYNPVFMTSFIMMHYFWYLIMIGGKKYIQLQYKNHASLRFQ